ncbi:MAG: hypothetical protein U9R15_20155, partial [Chloroflexota bacterium]|nr:hypothetical protein [Chloroflexota bacterium]
MKRNSRPTCRMLLPVLAVLALALLAYPALTTSAEQNTIAAVWNRARESGVYHFSADVRQTTAPLSTVRNVGRASKEQAIHLEGETNLPDRQLHLTLWSQGGSVLNAASGVEIKVEGERAYGRRGAQDWEEINNFTGLFAPQGDFMAFLSAAKDVRSIPNPQFPNSPTRYTFRIDGHSYAAYLRDQMERRLTETGELPTSVTLDLPKQYVDMTGTGELWVSADGLPVRQILHLHFPPTPDEQEISAEVTVDFAGFEQTSASRFTFHVSRIADHGLRFTLFLAFCIVLIAYSRSKKLYAAIAIVIITSMTVTPLLQSVQAADFANRQAAKASEAETREQESDMQRAFDALLTESDHHPNLDPLTNSELR